MTTKDLKRLAAGKNRNNKLVFTYKGITLENFTVEIKWDNKQGWITQLNFNDPTQNTK